MTVREGKASLRVETLEKYVARSPLAGAFHCENYGNRELSLLNAALRSSLVIHGLKDEFNLLARQQLELGSVHQQLLVFRIGAEHPHLEGALARRPAIKTAGQAPRVEGHAIGRAGRLSRNAQCANANVNFSG